MPYFMDPLNRAVEEAWEAGIVVVAAAGNEGPGAETITVPGNDPYVITVGAVDGRRTPGYWKDDIIPSWSASGPTLDGFLKPDMLAPGAHVVSFMHNGLLPAKIHPGAAAPGLLADQQPVPHERHQHGDRHHLGGCGADAAEEPSLTPDQVKYRLMVTARQVNTPDGQPAFGLLQQGAGRIWAPDAVACLAAGWQRQCGHGPGGRPGSRLGIL